MLKLIFRVDLRAERLALEGIVKEFAAFVSCADNAESVADHLGTVAFEGCGVLAEFADAGQVGRALVFLSEHEKERCMYEIFKLYLKQGIEFLPYNESSLPERIEKMVEKFKLCDKVHFTGFVSEPEKLWANCDIFFFPIRWQEPFGLVALRN